MELLETDLNIIRFTVNFFFGDYVRFVFILVWYQDVYQNTSISFKVSTKFYFSVPEPPYLFSSQIAPSQYQITARSLFKVITFNHLVSISRYHKLSSIPGRSDLLQLINKIIFSYHVSMGPLVPLAILNRRPQDFFQDDELFLNVSGTKIN